MSRLNLFLSLLLSFTLQNLVAQVSLLGKLTDRETQSPVPFANIFIAGSQKGTVSDSSGQYLLENPGTGRTEVVVSHIGYETYTQVILVPEVKELEMNIVLTPRPLATENIDIEAKRSSAWKRSFKDFKQGFLGTSPLAAKCEILNPEVLIFQQNKRGLTASATDLLKIENRALGYLVLFSLDAFYQKGLTVSYGGKPLFIPLSPENEKEEKRWQKQRRIAYLGSPRHFYATITRNSWKEAGFEMYEASLKSDKKGFRRISTWHPELSSSSVQGTYGIPVNGFLEVVYTGENDWRNTSTGGPSGNSNGPGGATGGNRRSAGSAPVSRFQTSWVYCTKNHILVDGNGRVLNPQDTREYGFWAEEKVAELLPWDFTPTEYITPALQQQEMPALNGFQLTNAGIPVKEIHPGGPPKDGIPAIDRPVLGGAESGNWLADNAQVIGVEIGGEARAYPISILDRHEIVNDRFGEQPVAVTWCPLCGSGMVFLVEGEGNTSFGVSGLLYNSDVLLYDRATESLWSQIMGEAVTGPRSGETLQWYPSLLTSWSDWKNLHPDTRVLIPPNNNTRKYLEKAYPGYEESDRLFFPVSDISTLISNKTRVLGVQVGDHYRAYPYPALEQHKKPVEDHLGGINFTITFDRNTNKAVLTSEDLEQIRVVSLFWFAWYAFHPGTEVWEE